jgi:hypothetical protein
LEGSVIIIEDPVLSLFTVLSLNDKRVSNDVDGLTTGHSGVDREWNSDLDTKLFVGLTLGVLSINLGVINVSDVELLVYRVSWLV